MKNLLIMLLLGLVLYVSGCSCQSWNDAWGKGPREAWPDDVAFWDKNCKRIAKPAAPKPAPAPRPAPIKPPPVVRSQCGVSSATGHYPCKGCTVVRLEKNMPVEVAMNTKFDYTIKVVNPTDHMLSDVVVTENLADNFKLADTNPKAEVAGGKLTFKIGSLGPGQTRAVTISGTATNTDCLKTCAAVSYIIPTCASVRVVQPALKLVKTAPASVLLCEAIPVRFVVTNTGSGSAGSVRIEDALPAGLRTVDGKSRIMINAGTLDAGQSKEFTTTLKAQKTGKYVNKAVATSTAGLQAESETTTIVRQPVLAISKSGPEKRYLGRAVTFEITVSNKGDAPATKLVVEDRLPAGARFVSATGGGSLTQGKVVWNLGTLSAGSSRKVSLTVMPEEAGTVTNTATARATCAEDVRDSASTQVAGIPAVLLEVIDIDDPVEVGSQTTYVIVATNQGSSPGTNISIVCTLEDNEQYVSSSGATAGRLRDGTVTFAPLRSLAPKAKATWRVVVKAVKAGDVRFKVTMNTDQIDRPVEETEATHLYE